jgi:hypothetical protein
MQILYSIDLIILSVSLFDALLKFILGKGLCDILDKYVVRWIFVVTCVFCTTLV